MKTIVFGIYLSVVTSCAGHCPSGWTEYGNSCYMHTNKVVMTYYPAQSFCAAMGGHLIQIDDVDENRFAVKIAEQTGSGCMLMGCSNDINHSQLLWYPSMDNVTYSNWDKGEDIFHGNEHCVMLFKPGRYKWHDASCSSKCSVLCEKEQTHLKPKKPKKTVLPSHDGTVTTGKRKNFLHKYYINFH